MKKKLLSFVLLILSALSVHAEMERAPGSNVQHVSPEEGRFKRPFNIDNGGVTDSPITAEPGTWQIESELVNYSYTRPQDEPEKNVTFNYFIVRRALTETLDLEAGQFTYVNKSSDTPEEGLGDSIVRFKWTMIGDYTTKFSLALFPYLKLPTGAERISNNKVESGLTFPLSYQLNEKINLGFMPQWSYVPKSEGNGYFWSHRFAFCLSYQLSDQWLGFVEAYQQLESDTGSHGYGMGTLGFNYQITPYVMVNFGNFFGFSAAAPKYNPFLGLSARF